MNDAITLPRWGERHQLGHETARSPSAMSALAHPPG